MQPTKVSEECQSDNFASIVPLCWQARIGEFLTDEDFESMRQEDHADVSGSVGIRISACVSVYLCLAN